MTMEIALVEGLRRTPFTKGKGSCTVCGHAVLAKCGPRVRHHWAHARRQSCDPWWENETDWHRQWKSLFPEDCREVIHTAPDGEVHRADIRTPTGIYIEVQHSQITDQERLSRELFYQNLVWVVDGRGFRDRFDLYHLLPAPQSRLAQDLVWLKATRPMQGAARGIFWRLSENPGSTKTSRECVQVHGIHEIEAEVNALYVGHHQYDWVRPHKTWLDARCPVYIDFGKDYLVRLEVYDESQLRCVRLIARRKFLHDVMTETSANAIATRWYPLP